MSNQNYYGSSQTAPQQSSGANYGSQQMQGETAYEGARPQQGYEQSHRTNQQPQQFQQQEYSHGQGGQQQYPQGQGGQQHSHGQGQADAAEGYNEPLQKKDKMTEILEKLERKFGGERFTNPNNAAKNRAMNENIIKKLTYAAKLIMQKAPGYAMRYGRQLF